MTSLISSALSRRQGRGGFIMITVLWILGALATLISTYAIYVINTAAAFGFHDDRVRAEALVVAAIELTALQLARPAESRPRNGRFNIRLGQANVAVEFRSESARIDVNLASKELLAGLFTVFGVRLDQAEHYADRIVAWRTPPPQDDSSEALSYQKAGLPYVPRGARFPHTAELSLVLDIPTGLLERAMPFFTVYSGGPQVNIFDAPAEVVAALPGMTRDRLNAVLAQRRAAPRDGPMLLQALGPAQGYATTEASKASRVTVHISFDNGRRLSSEVVILVFEEGAEPYSVLSWHDQLEDPSADKL
jgi:general secretion pathway protein K